MGWGLFNRITPVRVGTGDHLFWLGLKRFGRGQEALVRKHKTIPYERSVIADFAREAERLKQGVVVDCGAYHGFYGLLASKINPGLAVFAIEPLPENVERLRQNLAFNGFNGIKIFEYAIGGENKITNFFHSKNKAWTAVGLDHPTRTRKKGGAVQQKTLAGFMGEAGISKIDILKMDIEGAELDALGSVDLDRINMVFVETHPNLLRERGGQSVRMIVDLFRHKKFDLSFCPEFGEEFIPVDPSIEQRHGYLVAKKR